MEQRIQAFLDQLEAKLAKLNASETFWLDDGERGWRNGEIDMLEDVIRDLKIAIKGD